MADKDLFVIREEEGIGTITSISCENDFDLMKVCFTLYSLLTENPTLRAGINAVQEMVENDPEFAQRLHENSIEVPDFNSLLKNNKTNN